MPKKRVCPRCKRKLWKRDFYIYKSGRISSYCKECEKEYHREIYNRRKRNVRTGVFYSQNAGRALNYQGYSISIYWNPAMIEKLKREYPTTKNAKLCTTFGVSRRTLVRKARELGLKKDAVWQSEMSRTNARIAIFMNKIRSNSGMIKKGEHKSPATEFKKKAI